MPFIYARLIEITTLPSTVGIMFTQPSGQKSYIRNIILHNTNTTTETVKLYKVPNNGNAVGTAADINNFYQDNLLANQTQIIDFSIPGLMLIDLNETIQGVTTTASKVTIEINGATDDSINTVTTTTNDGTTYIYSISLGDDNTTSLPAITTNGIGIIAAGTSPEYAEFIVDSTGTVTLIFNTDNVTANADTDGYLCIGTAAAQNPIIIKNRLGSSKTINIFILYK